MRVLFVMRHAGYVRNFESTLRMLCERGNRVHVAFQRELKTQKLDPGNIADLLARTYRQFTYGSAPVRLDSLGLAGRELRLGLDYLRYLAPAFSQAPKLRERATREAPAEVLDRTSRGFTSTRPGRLAMSWWMRAQERSIPSDPEIVAFVQKMRPDVVAVTPLLEPGAPQAEYIRSAKSLGIRTALCVASWDNLTSKGLIHGPVDLVTVWNEAMKQEAIELHGIPAHRIEVTGAVPFDHWFSWQPSTTREAFCARVGLPVERPFVLYLCSSRFIAPHEVPFIREWIGRIRQSSQTPLAIAGVLVRPHPQNTDQWEGVDLGDKDVVVWPRAGAAPVDEDSRNEYFDSIYPSGAVVGINTTAEIEAAIVGRRSYTLLADQFRETQGGTLHFRHLAGPDEGLVRVAGGFDEHMRQLNGALMDPEADRTDCQRFVARFVRPHGSDTPATPRLVKALEELSRRPPSRPPRASILAPLVLPRLMRRGEDLASALRASDDSKAERQAARRARHAAKRTGKSSTPRQVAVRIPVESHEVVESGTGVGSVVYSVPGVHQDREAAKAAKAAHAEDRRRRQAELRAAFAERVGQQGDAPPDDSWDSLKGFDRVEAIARAFCALGSAKRRGFLSLIQDFIPPPAYIDLVAAAPPRRLLYDRADIYMHVASKREAFRLRACAKEPFTVQWIHDHVRAGDVLYDIGANVGAYSLVAAMTPGGGARVVAFEPSYATFASMCANVMLNKLDKQVTPLPIALSDQTAMNVFNLRDLEPGSARHVLGRDAPDSDEPTLHEQAVMTFRLDDLVDTFDLPLPNHIKMDVDGGELEVLAGGSKTLATPSLRSMLIEVSMSLSDAVVRSLEAHGLHLASKYIVQGKSGEYGVWYGLFLRDGRAAAPTREAPAR